MTYNTTNQEVPASSWDIYQSSMYDLNLPEAVSETELHHPFTENFEMKMEDPYSPMTNLYQVCPPFLSLRNLFSHSAVRTLIHSRTF